MSLDPRNQSPAEFLRLSTGSGLAESQARSVLGSVLGSRDLSPESWIGKGIIPKRVRGIFASDLPVLELEKTVISPVDGFQKFLFRTSDRLAVETVLIPLHKSGKATVCLSSQVGCVMGCAFCATGRMKERRSLHTWEILDQFQQVRVHARERGLELSGAVFMGMGEPFLNYSRVLAAAEILSFPVKGSISGKAITISTVGLVSEIERYTDEKHPYRLSISLGAAIDEKRALLLPVAAKRWRVREVMSAARRYAIDRGDRINIAYVCVGGLNTTEADAEALGELVADTPVRLDLIDVTDSTGRFQPPSEAELSEFRDALRRYLPHPVARRYSGGADISAACGTLAGV